MKVILEPKVRIVGATQFFPHPEYEIPDDGSDACKLGSFAAKGCYDSYGKNGRPNIENQKAILEHRHGSVLEHSYISLFIEGVTRALTLELNRHRTFNISQRSTRYTKEEDSAIVLEPYFTELFKKYNPIQVHDSPYLSSSSWIIEGCVDYSDEQALICGFLNYAAFALWQYSSETDSLVEINSLDLKGFDLRKWARGKARNILPHALETRGTYTNNHRGWRWFIEIRSDKHAEPEIRRLADVILKALKEFAPEYYEDFEMIEIYDNIPVWKPKYSKV